MTSGRGIGKTPQRIVDLVREAVGKKSQSAVAREVGIPLRSVQNYMQGISEPTTATLEKLADYFGIPVNVLREGAQAELEMILNRVSFLVEELKNMVESGVKTDDEYFLATLKNLSDLSKLRGVPRIYRCNAEQTKDEK